MVGSSKPVRPSTKWILSAATVVALGALAATALVFDEKSEAGPPTERIFLVLIGIVLGAAPLLAGLAALAFAGRPHSPKLMPVALAAIAFGALMSWLLLIEYSALPNYWIH